MDWGRPRRRRCRRQIERGPRALPGEEAVMSNPVLVGYAALLLRVALALMFFAHA